MTPPRIPSLSDLVLLWLEEKIGKGHRIEYGGGRRMRSYLDLSDYKLRIDGVVIGWLHDSYFELCGGSESAGKILFPENPEFFDQLWAHMEKMSEGFDPLYQQKLTTYLKGKNE